MTSLKGSRYPFSGSIDLTARCNLGCVHCYINEPAGNRAERARELSTAQVLGILDQVADAGCLFLLVTGGEPLLRPDFSEIYRHAKRLGLLVTLFTNGTLLTEKTADLLAELPPFGIEVTLYGATAGTYDRVTRVPGAYARCRRGIDMVLKRGLPLSLKSVIIRENRHELEQMQALARELGVQFRYDGVLWPRLDGGREPLAHRLSPEDLVAIDQDDTERQQEWAKLADEAEGKLVRSERVYTCGATMFSFHVSSSGRMSMCMVARQPSYDLKDMAFLEAWQRLGELPGLKRQGHTECETCSVGELCFQCPGWSQVVHGDNEMVVEYVCTLGRLRRAQVKTARQ